MLATKHRQLRMHVPPFPNPPWRSLTDDTPREEPVKAIQHGYNNSAGYGGYEYDQYAHKQNSPTQRSPYAPPSSIRYGNSYKQPVQSQHYKHAQAQENRCLWRGSDGVYRDQWGREVDIGETYESVREDVWPGEETPLHDDDIMKAKATARGGDQQEWERQRGHRNTRPRG